MCQLYVRIDDIGKVVLPVVVTISKNNFREAAKARLCCMNPLLPAPAAESGGAAMTVGVARLGF